MPHPTSRARLTAERRHYKDFRIGDNRIQAVSDQYGNRALWVVGYGKVRLIFSARPKHGTFSDARTVFRQHPNGRSFRVCYYFNPAIIHSLGKRPFKVPASFISKPKAQPGNRPIKVAWLTAQARHYHNFLMADGHKITLNYYRGKGEIRTLNK